MGLFANLLSKIFSHQTATKASPTSSPASAVGEPAQPGLSVAAAAPVTAQPPPSVVAAAPARTVVDVTAILDGLAAKNPEKLDWRSSIVDLMKLVDMDSSLGARKELAKDLNYTGDTSDSGTMNIWLHRAVITKIAENGGKVPADLLTK